MSNLVAISPTLHGTMRWKSRSSFSDLSQKSLVEVFITELGDLVDKYPLAFIKTDSSFDLVGLLSLGENRNLYVDLEGLWLSDYVPASIRCYPFCVADNPDNPSGKSVLIDEAQLTSDPSGEPLFEDNGERTDSLENVLQFLTRCERDKIVTQLACAALSDAGVLEEWPLTINIDQHETSTSISGLFRVNEAKLNSIDEKVFAELRKSGAVSLAYAQFFSMLQLSKLEERFQFLSQQELNNETLN